MNLLTINCREFPSPHGHLSAGTALISNVNDMCSHKHLLSSQDPSLMCSGALANATDLPDSFLSPEMK